jgi:23S rRNA (cytosine1962-C5)-methyltransferase
MEGEVNTGDLISVYNSRDIYLGSGFYNKNSLISARLLGKFFADDISVYIKEAIHKANEYRKKVYPGRNSYRLCFSESDFLPGLIIDKYNDTYVLQVYSAGMQKNIGHVIHVLKDELNAKNIFSQNEPYFRKLEGLPEEDEIYLGEIGSESISDGRISYKIDFSDSQKTGFYFDQCDNRKFIERFVKDKNVLDAFCNSGGFGLHAAHAGAKAVTFVDSSETEIENAKENYALNSFKDKAGFVTSDVFDYFEKCIYERKKFDIIMLDPPAFAKSRKSIPTALKGYTKLNKLALSCTSKEGYLATSSCSYHIKEEDFHWAVIKAAQKAGKTVQLIYKNGAALDHPQIPAMEETKYLKFLVYRVL